MKCANCGTENVDGGRFCYNCGASLASAAPGQVSRPDPQPASSASGEVGKPVAGEPPPNSPAAETPIDRTVVMSIRPGMFAPPLPAGSVPPATPAAATAEFNYSEPPPLPNVSFAPESSPAPTVVAKTATLAIVSLAFGVLAALVVCNPIFISSLVAIVTGVMARGKISRSSGALKGRGMAMTGIVLGVLGALLNIAVAVLVALNVLSQTAR